MNSNEMGRRCDKMMKILTDASKVDTVFERAAKVIDKVTGKNLERDNVRTITTTEEIIKQLAKK